MEKFKSEDIYSGFKLIEAQCIDDIQSTCYVFEHIKSGARLFYADNSDDNRVFFIAFKTPPADSCGTAHIMEHSVLCGSEKFKAKDPFNELAKGSLSTYLNALTYADKTMYPVASCNEKDFENLMSVYTDAVFAPVVMQEKKIFMQEGWHYELKDEKSPLVYKGVVYNEMKGALSAPERVLNNCINRSLFGDTCYGYESGGDPEDIVKLSYEDFKDFYKKYYHPSNSYIYFYGQTDIKKHMEFLDKNYLSRFEKTDIASDIKDVSSPFEKEVHEFYSVGKGEKTENDSIFSLNYVLCKNTDIGTSAALQILTYILLDTNASPLKKALIESGIGQDVQGWYDDSIYQCVLNIVAKNCRKSDAKKFKNTIKKTLEKVCEEGLDKDLVVSALNYWEFMIREADYGYKPKGLAYGMDMMKGWINGQNPLECMKVWKHFDVMRKGVGNGYFESLIKKYMLENDFSTFVEIEAKEGMQLEQDNLTAQNLEEYKKSLTKEERLDIIKRTEELIKYQQTADTQETIDRIPLLEVEEIDKTKKYDEMKEKGNFLVLNGDTSGIIYVKAVFRADCVKEEDICYVGLLKNAMGEIDTEKYDFSVLPMEINMYTGGIYCDTLSFKKKDEKFTPALAVNGKALMRNGDRLFELMENIICTSRFDKNENLLKIIRETKGYLERKFDDSGHSVAVMRALSNCKKSAAYNDATEGIRYYDFILWAEKNIDKVCEKLKETAEKIFTRENLIFTFACDKENTEKTVLLAEKFKNRLKNTHYEKTECDFKAEFSRQAIITSSKVVYNSKAADFKALGFEYSGKTAVVKKIVNNEYLWNEVRVRGGAYGSGCNILRNGGIYTYSYRDPNVKNTYDIYESTGDFLRSIKLNSREMTKYIIGAINDIDKPKSMQTRLDMTVNSYLNGITSEMKQRERDELLSTKESDIAAFGELFDAAMKNDVCFTLGNESKIENDKKLFDDIRSLKKVK